MTANYKKVAAPFWIKEIIEIVAGRFKDNTNYLGSDQHRHKGLYDGPVQYSYPSYKD